MLSQVKKDKEEGKKKRKFQLGVAESKMGNSTQEETGIPCVCNALTGEVLRGIRMHATRFMKDLQESDMNKVALLFPQLVACICIMTGYAEIDSSKLALLFLQQMALLRFAWHQDACLVLHQRP